MRNLGRNVNHVSGAERVAFSSLDAGAQILARPAAGLWVHHLAAQQQRPFAALHDDDVDDPVVLLGQAISIPIEQPEAVITIVSQCFAGGVIRADFLGERLVALFQLSGAPEREPGRIRRQDRHDEKSEP